MIKPKQVLVSPILLSEVLRYLKSLELKSISGLRLSSTESNSLISESEVIEEGLSLSELKLSHPNLINQAILELESQLRTQIPERMLLSEFLRENNHKQLVELSKKIRCTTEMQSFLELKASIDRSGSFDPITYIDYDYSIDRFKSPVIDAFYSLFTFFKMLDFNKITFTSKEGLDAAIICYPEIKDMISDNSSKSNSPLRSYNKHFALSLASALKGNSSSFGIKDK